MKHLFASRLPFHPKDFFEDCAQQCVQYNIQKADMYNDYDQTAQTSSLRAFEADVARHIGKEDGIYVPSGCMAQLMVLAMNKERSQSSHFVCHWSSHLLIHEHDSYKHVLNMNALILPPNENAAVQEPFTYSSFMELLEEHKEKKIAMVFVECPHREIGGEVTSWEDLEKISAYCREHQIHLHMDGARLWEASAAYEGHSIQELCSFFDSVYCSFYKGIGAITGSMLLGKSQFIIDSRVWLRRFGGNLFCHLPYFVSCLSCFHKNKDSFQERKNRFVEIVDHLTKELSSSQPPEQKLIYFDPPLPRVSLIHVYLLGDLEKVTAANQRAAEKSGIMCFQRFRPGRFGAKAYCYAEINLVRYPWIISRIGIF
jgi:threonine aldolase